MVITTGTFLGPLMAGFLYDLHRSYTLAFSLFAVISLVSVVCMLLGKPPGKQAAFKSG
jgi:cyanate permease